MAPPEDNVPSDPNPLTGIDIKRPMTSSVGIGPDNQSAFTSDSTTNESEKLLDIDGLLEIVRLISRIREDRRLGCVVDGESSDHVDE